MESVLCWLSYLLLVWDSRHIRPDAADLFSCVSSAHAYVPRVLTSATFLKRVGPEILTDAIWCRTRRWSEPG